MSCIKQKLSLVSKVQVGHAVGMIISKDIRSKLPILPLNIVLFTFPFSTLSVVPLVFHFVYGI